MSGGGAGRAVSARAREAPAPQDERVSRRWFVERMAWVSSAAAAGTPVCAHAGGREPARPRR